MAAAYSESKPKIEITLTRRDLWVLGVAVLAISAIYLVASALTFRIGFPLDDSWIHQTFARNLALRGEWAFRPGIPSAGSTSPLWSALLAIGFLLRLAPYIWTYLLGGVILFGLGAVMEIGARHVMDSYRPRTPWVGIFFVAEWHMAWAAMSGMETLLHTLIISAALILLMTNSRRYLTLGLLTGLSVWVRPDGLTLIGPVLMVLLLTEGGNAFRVRGMVRFLIGLGALLLPYLLFNLAIGGMPMPNTFYAKQAEYIGWQSLPLTDRLGQMSLQLLVGPGVMLLPGMIGWLIVSVRRRTWSMLASMLWFAGYVGLYISRLPVYQHGRYIIPAMAVFYLWGIFGLIEFARSNLFRRHHWFVLIAWRFAVVLLVISFVFLGARSYAEDVAVIESEMVTTAKWASKNIPPDAIIAAHDIGALGYFDNHPLIDLAGLVSPEVIPFIRNEGRLASYLTERHADYLIAFPGFYPELVRHARPVFTSGGTFAPAYGEENMVVYRWERP